MKANAENLKAFLDKEGYSASVAFNADNSMYRVIVATYHDRDSAAAARDAFKAKYPNRNDFKVLGCFIASIDGWIRNERLFCFMWI